MNFRILSILAACIASVTASGASAQIIASAVGNSIGNAQSNWFFVRCAGGRSPLSEAAARAADTPAKAAIAKYWATVSATHNAQIGSLFDPSGRAVWVANGVEVRVHSHLVTDPFARGEGAVLAAQPLKLVRSGDEQTARGIWEVNNSSGSLVGYYRIDFTQNSNWRPIRVELLPPSTPSPTVTPYCYKPGDVETYSDAEKAISESQIAKLTKKTTVVATCTQGSDCSEKWSRAQSWVEENRTYLLIRNTEKLLLTAMPVEADVSSSYLVVLDPPTPDGRQAIRFRSWCRNWFACFPAAANAQQNFVASLEQTPTGRSQTTM